ncbi:hypothetical protein Trydic_g6674 [Trypoxylus dichotomus]
MSFLSVYSINLYIPPNIGLDDYGPFIDALRIFLLDKHYILVGYFNTLGFSAADFDEEELAVSTHYKLKWEVSGPGSYKPGCRIHNYP